MQDWTVEQCELRTETEALNTHRSAPNNDGGVLSLHLVILGSFSLQSLSKKYSPKIICLLLGISFRLSLFVIAIVIIRNGEAFEVFVRWGNNGREPGKMGLVGTFGDGVRGINMGCVWYAGDQRRRPEVLEAQNFCSSPLELKLNVDVCR